MRIAVGGFQHETNTFAPSKAELGDFTRGDGAWPALTRGDKLPGDVQGINIGIAGGIERLKALGHEIHPTAWAAACPSAHVTEEAFETIAGMIVEGLREARHLDGVYLCLHGAMVTEHLEDGEGELLRRVRAVVDDLPVVASLDLHANVTPEMIEHADGLVIYRTYPHVDMAETGARAAQLLHARLERGAPFEKAFRQLPFLIPLTSGCTMVDPAAGIYRMVSDADAEEGVISTSFACGFSPADIYHAGPSAVAYGARAQEVVDRICDAAEAREAEFGGDIYPAAEAVARAMETAKSAQRPVVIADTQDNPGAGGNSDTTGLLAELVRQNAQDAALAILYDPKSAEAAHAAGEGAEVSLKLGAISGLPGHEPFEARVRVEALTQGRFVGTGPFYKNAPFDMGPTALLRIGGVRVIVGSAKVQAADQEIFRHIGVEPAEQKILALKSSVHFRADFQPIAEEVLIAAAPGPNPVDHTDLDYQRLRPGLRIMPGGPVS